MTRFSSYPVRVQLIILAVLLTLPALGIIVSSGLKQRADDYSNAGIETQRLADNLAVAVGILQHDAEQLGSILSALPDIKGRNTSKATAILSNTLKKNPQYNTILIVDDAGTAWVSTSPLTARASVAERRYFLNARATKRFSSGEFVMSKSSQTPTIHLAYPIVEGGEFLGAVIFGFNLEVLRGILERSQLSEHSNYVLTDHKGIIISRGRSEGQDIGKPIQLNDLKRMENGPDKDTYEFVRFDGVRRIVTYHKLRLEGEQAPFMYVRAGISIKGALAKANKRLVYNISTLLSFIVIAFGLASLIAKRSIVDRIVTLQTASQQLARGDFSIRIADQVEGGELGALGRAFDDMTENLAKKIQERNLVAEEYQAVIQTTSDGFSICDSQGRILEVNSAFCAMHGYSRQELLQLTIADIEAVESSEMVESHNKMIIEAGSDSFTSRHRRKDGSTVDVDVTVIYLNENGGRFFGFIRDITERKRFESELHRREQDLANSERFLKTIIDSEPECIKMLDIDGNLLMMNPAGLKMIEADSFEQVKGKCVCPLITDTYRDAFIALTRQVFQGMPGILEFETIGLKGRHIWLETHAVPFRNEQEEIVALLGITRDVTERKKLADERRALEWQFHQSQKLESLGVLAGGIAHDFNNILTSIVGNVDLALMRLDPASPVIENLHRIEKGAARAADLAKQMLAYSGKGKFVIEDINLNSLLEEMLHMLEVSISKKVELQFNQAINLPSVEADATQLRQIIMNLVINASEAIGDNSGTISITTGCIDCDKNYLKSFWLAEDLREGQYVYLEITDSGCGMDKETQCKIFDPFFTTKFTGRGLGMAAVLGIIRGHKGTIKIYSESGKGSAFKILLPVSGKPGKAIGNHDPQVDWKGHGKVLLVDDEETVRDIGKEMLQELGFTVLFANDGQEALEVFNATPDISFIILDLTMPHMDGEQCFYELQKIKPDVKVIVSSGFSEHEVTQKFVGKGLAGFIQKPYKLSALKEAIHKI